MKLHLCVSILSIAALTLFSGCDAYPASSTVTTSIPIQITKESAKPTISLTAPQIITLFATHGIPVHTLSAIAGGLTFTDDRLSSKTDESASSLFLFASEEEATVKYKTLISSNTTGQYLYQNKNILLLLSNQFTQAQAKEYESVFSILGDLGAASRLPVFQQDTNQKNSGDHSSKVTSSPVKTTFSDGTYIIGSIMPAGEYVILSSDRPCRVKLKEGTGKRTIIYNSSFFHNIILSVKATEVLTIKNGTAFPLAEGGSLNTSAEGMFKVGPQLAPGTYQITLSNTNLIGFGCFQIMKDARFSEDSILTSKTFTKPVEITLKKGQYIKLSGACLSLD